MTEARGDAFEQFILNELTAHEAYSELNYPIRFWRTKSGLEVDFVLGDGDGEVAVAVKGRRSSNHESRSPATTTSSSAISGGKSVSIVSHRRSIFNTS